MRGAGKLVDLDVLRPSDHVCWVVGPDDGYDEIAAACADAGADAGDKVFLFGPVDGLAAPPAKAAVRRADPHTAFLAGGELDADAMLTMFRDQAALARAEGYRALRVVADMDWLLARPPAEDALAAFELRLDEVVAEIAATVVCAYRTRSFLSSELARVAGVHPLDYGTLPAPPGFRVWSTGPATWDVSGEIDVVNADMFAATLLVAADVTHDVRFRLGGVGFIDLAGARAFVDAARARPGRTVTLDAVPDTLRHCWTLLGYDVTVPFVVLAS